MKTKLLTFTAMATMAAALQTAVAQTNTNLFPVVFRAVCVSTNGTNGLMRQTVTATNLIAECAGNMGVTNLADLSLVFNRSNSSLEVINATNGTLVCPSLSFSSGMSFTNTNATLVMFQQFVFVGNNTVASGVISGTERLTFDIHTNLTSFGVEGSLLFAEPATGTNQAAICRGTLLVGSAITAQGEGEDQDEDMDGESPHGHQGNQGENGNQGNGNQGNHDRGGG